MKGSSGGKEVALQGSCCTTSRDVRHTEFVWQLGNS